jgi:predicted neutral ceramidase superfamily lipid hydrolase
MNPYFQLESSNNFQVILSFNFKSKPVGCFFEASGPIHLFIKLSRVALITFFFVMQTLIHHLNNKITFKLGLLPVLILMMVCLIMWKTIYHLFLLLTFLSNSLSVDLKYPYLRILNFFSFSLIYFRQYFWYPSFPKFC